MNKYVIFESTLHCLNGLHVEFEVFSVEELFKQLNKKLIDAKVYNKTNEILVVTTNYLIKLRKVEE